MDIIIKPLVIILMTGISLAGCGGGGSNAGTSGSPASNQNPAAVTLITGLFIDSPVNGLEYQGNPSGRSGITGESGVNGEFTVAVNDSITFRLGNLVIGTTGPLIFDRVITPMSLSDDPSIPFSARIVRIAQLLQSLDTDRIPSNGINIAPEIRDRLRNGSVNTETLQSALQDGLNFNNVLGAMIQTLTSGNANRGPNQIVSSLNAQLELGPASRLAMRLNLEWPATGVPVSVIDAKLAGPVFAGPNIIELNGTRSLDFDNQPLTYLWSIIAKPTGTNPMLSSPAFVTTNFSFPDTGDYTVELRVTDSSGLSSTDVVDIFHDETVTRISYRLPGTLVRL